MFNEGELLREGYRHFADGDFAAAMACFESSYQLSPDAQPLRGIGECHLSQDRPRDAILYFAASTGLRPHPRVTYDLAQCLFRCGFIDEAKRAAKRAIAMLPHFKQAEELLTAIEAHEQSTTNGRRPNNDASR